MSIGSRRRVWIALGLVPWLANCAPTRSAPAATPPVPTRGRNVEPGGGDRCRAARSAAELHADVRRSLAALSAVPTPLLPDRWPAPAAIVVYAYESIPLPTGVVAYAVRGPSARIVFDAPELVARVERFDAVVDLGTRRGRLEDESDRLLQGLAAAEGALVEIVARCRESAAARPALDPYRAWFRVHPLIAAGLGEGVRGFRRWLEKEPR